MAKEGNLLKGPQMRRAFSKQTNAQTATSVDVGSSHIWSARSCFYDYHFTYSFFLPFDVSVCEMSGENFSGGTKCFVCYDHQLQNALRLVVPLRPLK